MTFVAIGALRVKFNDLLVDSFTSFGRLFYFHEIIYDIQPCSIDNRWCNIVFITNGSSKHTYNKHFILNKSYWEF